MKALTGIEQHYESLLAERYTWMMGCLEELDTLCAGLPVEALRGDLTDVTKYAARGPFAAILCVGDTLTHLASSHGISSQRMPS